MIKYLQTKRNRGLRMINKKVRVYQTPLERANTSYDTEVHKEIIHQEKNF